MKNTLISISVVLFISYVVCTVVATSNNGEVIELNKCNEQSPVELNISYNSSHELGSEELDDSLLRVSLVLKEPHCGNASLNVKVSSLSDDTLISIDVAKIVILFGEDETEGYLMDSGQILENSIEVFYEQENFCISSIQISTDKLETLEKLGLLLENSGEDNLFNTNETESSNYCMKGCWNGLKDDTQTQNISVLLGPCMSIENNGFRVLKAGKTGERNWEDYFVLFVTDIPSGIIFLAILIIYLAIWRKHRAHGWAITGYVASQFLLYVFRVMLLTTRLLGCDFRVDPQMKKFCVPSAILQHFFSINTYSWTLVLTFDTWTTLNSIQTQSNKRQRLALFYGFALGVPALIVAVASVMEFYPGIHDVVKPGYQEFCEIPAGDSFMLYIGLSHIVLYGINLFLAGLTLRSLWAAKENAKQLTTSRKRATIKHKVTIMSKLLHLLGFCLLTAVVLTFGELRRRNTWFTLVEIHKLAQAGGLYWTFVCGVKTKQHVRERFSTKNKRWSIQSSSKSLVSRSSWMSGLSLKK